MASKKPLKEPLPKGSPFVGMPAMLKLNEFGGMVTAAFGIVPCLVGSSLLRKDWRDVDVRLVLPNDVYCRVFELDVDAVRKQHEAGEIVLDNERDAFAHAAHKHHNAGTHSCPRWVSLCRAYAALGAEMTGLPIDFQIEPHYVAEQLHPYASNHRYRLWSIAERAAARSVQ